MLYRANLIKEKMTELGITIEEMCERTGLSNETLWRIRRGENTTILNLQKVSQALGLELSELVEEKAA
jgi:transcriptional regulator with XRE-family HTH domain